MNNNIQKNKNFFNRWVHSYDCWLFQFWMKRFYLPVLQSLTLTPKTCILDISCGTGELLQRLRGKADLYGVDLSEEMLAKARAKLPAEIKLVPADVHNLPFDDNFFNYAITTEAFHHYYNQKLALHEMVRVTKNGGTIIVSDINFFLRGIHWFFEKLEPGCVKINSRKEMRQLFERANLKNIRQQRNFLFAVMTIGKKMIFGEL